MLKRKPSSPLRDRRREMDVTLYELADHVGLSVAMLSHVERGRRRLSREHQILVAKALKVPVDRVFPPMETA